MFRVGQFARFGGVSVRMLRHYDQIGLLKPVRIDAATRYRYYQAEQLEHLHRIRALRQLGLSLDQISRLLANADGLDDLLERQERQIRRDLSLLAGQLNAVRRRRKLGAGRYEVVVRAVAPQLVASIRTTLGRDEVVGPLFVEVESHVIAAEARANGPPLLLYHHYTKGDIEVAVPLSHPVAGGGDIRVYRLCGSPTMATTIHMGGYHSIDDALLALLLYVEQSEGRTNGPIREVYLRFSAEDHLDIPATYLTGDPDEFVTEVQVPVANLQA